MARQRRTTSRAGAKRGRPLKFGRPAQVVALTLPADVVAWLGEMDHDLAWAIVRLYERQTRQRFENPRGERRVVDLVRVGPRQSLIVVDQESFIGLPGVDLVPLAQTGLAFLALKTGMGLADLELAVVDQLDSGTMHTPMREQLLRLRAQLRAWRTDTTLVFSPRAIIVAEQRAAASRPRKSRE